jgi:hypothetical protein
MYLNLLKGGVENIFSIEKGDTGLTISIWEEETNEKTKIIFIKNSPAVINEY